MNIKFFQYPIKLDINKNYYEEKVLRLFENPKLYEKIINNKNITNKTKAKLELKLIFSLLEDLILSNYKKEHQIKSAYVNKKYQNNENTDIYRELEKIIDRGFVFNFQLTSVLILHLVFGYLEVFDNISNRLKLSCYKKFSYLKLTSKKYIAQLCLKSRNDEAILNLLSYGLKLDWEIEKENKKNLIGFELLSNNNWVGTIINGDYFKINIKTSNNDNILHVISSSILQDIKIESSIRRKIEELSEEEKNSLFIGVNQDGLTPMMKAILYQDIELINFIISFNCNPWDNVIDSPFGNSALDFLDNYILKDKMEDSPVINYFKSSFWFELSKRWNAQYCYLKLQDEMKNEKKSIGLIKNLKI